MFIILQCALNIVYSTEFTETPTTYYQYMELNAPTIITAELLEWILLNNRAQMSMT